LETSIMRSAWFPILTLGLAACGGNSVTLQATFPDELLEAPARTVDIVAVVGGDCEQLLTVPHDEISSLAMIHTRRQTAYPIDPDSNILEGVPSGIGVALDIAAYDDVPQQIARNCQVVVISASEDTEIKVPMLGLPECAKDPNSLDLVILLDASLRTSVADVGMENLLIDRLKSFVNAGFGAGTTMTLISHGPTEPMTAVARTEDPALISAGLDSLRTGYGGMGLPYAALTYSSTLLRTRAVCGYRPVILMVQSDTDPGLPGAFQEAVIGLFSDQTNPNDDIFVAAITLTGDASSAVGQLLGDDFGEIFGASTLLALNNALGAARLRIQGLITLTD
jgi:hypothetical protein